MRYFKRKSAHYSRKQVRKKKKDEVHDKAENRKFGAE